MPARRERADGISEDDRARERSARERPARSHIRASGEQLRERAEKYRLAGDRDREQACNILAAEADAAAAREDHDNLVRWASQLIGEEAMF